MSFFEGHRTDLGGHEITIVTTIERVNCSISILAAAFIICTFCFSKYFNTSINRLIFYASFGNLISNIAIMMSRSFIDTPNFAACQAQAFLIQAFLPADALWTLAMAINVYLTFYHKYEARDLRKIEPIYLMLCYGLPLVPATVFLFVKDREGARIYGPSVSYCWISHEWDILRLTVFYAPMWCIVIITFTIYIRAARTIYKVRRQVYTFQSSDLDPISVDEVTSPIQSTDAALNIEAMSERPPTFERNLSLSQPIYAAGSSSETATRPQSIHVATNKSSQSDGTQSTFYYYNTPPHRGSNPPQPPRNNSGSAATRAFRVIRRRNHERDNAAWTYTKVALLFFTAMLITWIPSTANRAYSTAHNGEIYIPLVYTSVFVLPLQGFWNCLVYVTTSWTACKNLFNDMWLAGRAFAIKHVECIRRRTEADERRQSLPA
ncbi:putative G-protein coupled receptor protein [Trichoderma barbatum]